MDAATSGSSTWLTVAKLVALLWLALAIVFPLFAWYGHSASGDDGVLAAVVAAVVSGLGGSLALVATAIARAMGQPIGGVMLGMLFRMGLPLAVGMYLSFRGGPLAEAGVFPMIVGYYLVMLVAETLLSLRLVNPTGSVSRAL